MGKQGLLKKPAHCAYCGEWTEKPEIEHVLPRTWYAKGTLDSDMMKVPACGTCADQFQWAEERSRELLAIAVDFNEPGAAGVYEAVLRSSDPRLGKDPKDADRRRARGERIVKRTRILRAEELSPGIRAVQRDMPPATWIPLGHGPRAQDWVFRFGYAVANVDALAEDAFFSKLVRGSYRYATGAPLAKGVRVAQQSCSDRARALEVGKDMREYFRSTSSFTVCGLIRGDDSVWIFEVLGQVLWFGFSGALCPPAQP